MDMLSILTFSHDRIGRLSSGTSHMIEDSIGYNSVRLKLQTCRIIKTLYVKNRLKLENMVSSECRYFGLFLSCARGTTVLFLPGIDLDKTHLLILNYVG
jgi:hypothetical protein